MPYFITLSGSPTKFSKSGFLLRSVALILEERAIEFRAVHALDLPSSEPATRRIANQFIADTVEQIERAAAIVSSHTGDERKFADPACFPAQSASGQCIPEEACVIVRNRWVAWTGRDPGTRPEADPVSSWYSGDCRSGPCRNRELDYSRRRPSPFVREEQSGKSLMRSI